MIILLGVGILLVLLLVKCIGGFVCVLQELLLVLGEGEVVLVLFFVLKEVNDVGVVLVIVLDVLWWVEMCCCESEVKFVDMVYCLVVYM